MAIWQWSISIVPRREVLKHFTGIPNLVDLDWFDTIAWWGSTSAYQLCTFFDTLLPKIETPWAENTTIWGSVDEDRLQLSVEADKVTDIWIRLDLRNVNIPLLYALASFADQNGFIFYSDGSGHFMEPVMDILLDNAKESRNMKFVSNPEKFLLNDRSLDKINKENERKLRNMKKEFPGSTDAE